MRVFFDSSGLAKRYLRESGSEAVERVLAEAAEAAVSVVGPPEIVSALCRLKRQKLLTEGQYGGAKSALFADIEDMPIVNLTLPVLLTAIGLLEEHPLRTLDALHVACALEWRADLFVSADRRQLEAAEASGLHVLMV